MQVGSQAALLEGSKLTCANGGQIPDSIKEIKQRKKNYYVFKYNEYKTLNEK